MVKSNAVSLLAASWGIVKKTAREGLREKDCARRLIVSGLA